MNVRRYENKLLLEPEVEYELRKELLFELLSRRSEEFLSLPILSDIKSNINDLVDIVTKNFKSVEDTLP